MSEEAQKLAQQVRVLEAYYSEFAQREGVLTNMYRDAAAASEALRVVGDGPAEALVPVGAGAHVPASLRPGGGVVVDIGAGVAIEKDRESAMSYLEGRIKEVDAAMRDNSARLSDVARQLEGARARLEQVVQAARPDV
ncbi:MAG: prefoldin subunit alpha [Nitrosopumilus sp.]|nr:prefoldin subunit alpha [Nitrosopumilus sp.]